MKIRLLLPLTFFVACALLGAGCSSGPATAPVKGTVTFEGKPVASGTIRFEGPAARAATGKIVQGQIVEVSTFQPDDGVPLGSHKVAIWAFAEAPSAPDPTKNDLSYMSGKSLIPESYNNPDTSGLSADIQPGLNSLEFKLSAKPGAK